MLVLRKEGGEGGRKKGKKVENFKSNCTTGYRKILNHELKLVEGKNSEEKFIEVPKVGIGTITIGIAATEDFYLLRFSGGWTGMLLMCTRDPVTAPHSNQTPAGKTLGSDMCSYKK